MTDSDHTNATGEPMMTNWRRREFLGATLGGMAAGWAWPGMGEDWSLEAAETDAAADVPKVAGPDTLFLTWQRDPTTTMTIQWLGDGSSKPAEVQFAVRESTDWQTASVMRKPYPNTELRVHRCELTGLRPGTEYQFRLGMAEPTLRFRTMPAKATDSFQFVTGGDAGVDEHAIATNRLAAKQEPYFALIAGDLAYDNGKSPKTFTQYLQNYRAHMVDGQGRLIPMLSCLGNHEVLNGYQCTREEAPQYLSVFDGLFAERTYNVLDFGDYLSLVLLDTDHIAPIAGEQTDWLARTLAERADRPHLFVANHVPAYPSYRNPTGSNGKFGTGEEQRVHWCPLFERHKVDIVLEHHDHTFKRTHPLTNGLRDPNGVTYLGDGSWGKLRIPKTPEERPYLAKVSSTYHLTVHTLEGDRRAHVALESSGRVADVLMSTGKRPAR